MSVKRKGLKKDECDLPEDITIVLTIVVVVVGWFKFASGTNC